MNQVWPIRLFVLFGAGGLHAGPAEDAVVALMRLSDQPSYSWITTVSDDARTYEIDGRTSRTGFSHVKMPVINSVRRKLGRDVSDTRIEMIFRGNAECVLRTEEGWRRPDELPEPEAISDFDRLAANARAGASTALPTSVTTLKGSAIRRPTVHVPGPDEEKRAYSNLQLAISPPHEELGVIVSSHKEFNVDGDVVTGSLTEIGAQLLLVRDGQPEIIPLRASGTFKIWIRDGMVSRYQIRLDGTLSLAAKSGRVAVHVQQRAMTEISNVGTAKVEIPEAARLKLTAR